MSEAAPGWKPRTQDCDPQALMALSWPHRSRAQDGLGGGHCASQLRVAHPGQPFRGSLPPPANGQALGPRGTTREKREPVSLSHWPLCSGGAPRAPKSRKLECLKLCWRPSGSRMGSSRPS